MNLGKDTKIDPTCIFDKITENSQIGRFNFGDYCSKEQFQTIIDNMPWNESEIENGND